MNKKIDLIIEKILRVDLAGELGAKQIYKGQILANNGKNTDILEEMLSSELVHLEYFKKIAKMKQIRPTAMGPIWKIGALAMGFLSSKCGNDAQMACTVGVEEVIYKHYQNQIAKINSLLAELEKDSDEYNFLRELSEKISRFANEELEHGEIGLKNSDQSSIQYKVSKKISSCITKLAINISERI